MQNSDFIENRKYIIHTSILIVLLLFSLTSFIDGIICYTINTNYCPQLPNFSNTSSIYYSNNKNIGIPMIIIGIATLIPNIIGIMYRENKKPEEENLIEFNNRQKKYFVPLYVSYFMSCWGDRMWQFVIPVILMIIFKTTFIPTAVYSIIICLGNILGMQFIGSWIDKTNRLVVQKRSIIIENICILGSSIIIGSIPFVINVDNINISNYKSLIVIIGAILFSIIGEIMNNAQIISTERDWIIVMSNAIRNPIDNVNKIMKRIDLICKIIAPAIIGIIIDLFNDDSQKIFIAGIVIGVWNLISFPMELILKSYVYKQFPELGNKLNCSYYYEGDIDIDYNKNKRWFKTNNIKLYFNHMIFFASLAGCLLWMTVLSNGSIMTNYLQWRNINLTIIGASRGLGALMGFLGTFLYTEINNITNREEKTGLISLWGFLLLLLPILFAFIIKPHNKVSDYTLMISCIISRLMLWIFDLALQKIMQIIITVNYRGKINSMHTTMYQFFTLLINICGIIFYKPEHFIYLVIISISSVLISAIIFSIWYKRYVYDDDYIYSN